MKYCSNVAGSIVAAPAGTLNFLVDGSSKGATHPAAARKEAHTHMAQPEVFIVRVPVAFCTGSLTLYCGENDWYAGAVLPDALTSTLTYNTDCGSAAGFAVTGVADTLI